MFPNKGETLPEGWQQVKYSPHDKTADVNCGNQKHLVHSHTAFLCYLADISVLMRRFLPTNAGSPYMHAAQTLAFALASLFSGQEKIILASLDGLNNINDELVNFPATLVSLVVQSLCEVAQVFKATQSATVESKLLSLLAKLFDSFWQQINVVVCMRVMETCFLMRGTDEGLGVSSGIMRTLFRSGANAVKDCVCVCAESVSLEEEKKLMCGSHQNSVVFDISTILCVQ